MYVTPAKKFIRKGYYWSWHSWLLRGCAACIGEGLFAHGLGVPGLNQDLAIISCYDYTLVDHPGQLRVLHRTQSTTAPCVAYLDVHHTSWWGFWFQFRLEEWYMFVGIDWEIHGLFVGVTLFMEDHLGGSWDKMCAARIFLIILLF